MTNLIENNSSERKNLEVIESIQIENEKAFVSSKTVADHFGKSHKHVLRDIESLECSEEYRESNFGPSFYTAKSGNGAIRKYKCYNLTKDGFVFLAMGFTGKKAAMFKEAYINAFNKMEAALTKHYFRMNQDHYHFPISTADPETRVFQNVVMTPKVLMQSRKPELELIEQLEKDGFDVSGAKIRLEALYALADFQIMYNDMFNELHNGLDRVARLADKHRQTVWGKNVTFGNHRQLPY